MIRYDFQFILFPLDTGIISSTSTYPYNDRYLKKYDLIVLYYKSCLSL